MARKHSFFRSLVSDERGSRSSKRIIALVGMLVLCVALLISVFSKRTLTPSPELISAIELITISCIGATSVDKFAKRDNTPNETDSSLN